MEITIGLSCPDIYIDIEFIKQPCLHTNKIRIFYTSETIWTCYKSLSRKTLEKEKKRERLVILGMLINIHEQSSLLPFSKMTGLLSTVSSNLESAIVKKDHRVSLCCIIVLSKHMIGYWFFL